MTTVTFEHLSKSFVGLEKPVLKDFSLKVKSGELVSLLGPSGIGKSTLLKLIAGIERPDSGDIHYDGQSILSIAPNQRGAVFMFQKAYLFPFLSVGENIAFGLKVKGVSVKERRFRVAKMLDLIGLPGIENRRPGELSGGEQQRVALARSLVIHPKVLLLDEPFNSLDHPIRLSLQEAVRNIQQELGITTILVTHDLDEAMAMSDRMALLLNGHVAAIDRPNILFNYPPCVETAKFVGVSTFIDGEAKNGWLESALGKIKIVDQKKSGAAIFAIRPEHIRIQTEKCENSFRASVKNCVFRGEHLEYQVVLNGMTMRARVPGGEPIVEGKHVNVTLPRERLFEVIGSSSALNF